MLGRFGDSAAHLRPIREETIESHHGKNRMKRNRKKSSKIWLDFKRSFMILAHRQQADMTCFPKKNEGIKIITWLQGMASGHFN